MTFDAQTFLHNAELEFYWLLGRLGIDEPERDRLAFEMTRQLAESARYYQSLVEVVE